MQFSGLLFFGVIITNLASNFFGYKTYNDVTSAEEKLQQINESVRKFKIGFSLILIEHLFIIAIAIMLFLAFNQFHLILAIGWVIFRGTEGSMQIYNKKNYWGLLNLTKDYHNAGETVRNSLIETSQGILQSKNTNFIQAQIMFSFGTLSYSILFATIEPVPILIAWFGIGASIIYGIGNVLQLKTSEKSELSFFWGLGGLSILIFEILLGGWLLFFSSV
ncbi:MAG: DUF4386 domain-containing protein [Candidatus Hodarchaeales archaeon]